MGKVQTIVDRNFLYAVKKLKDYLYQDELRHYCELYCDKDNYENINSINKEHIFYYVKLIDNELTKLSKK